MHTSHWCFNPFILRELEFDVCRIAVHPNSEDDSMLDEERRQVPQEEAPAHHSQPNQGHRDHSMNSGT